MNNPVCLNSVLIGVNLTIHETHYEVEQHHLIERFKLQFVAKLGH